jgi:hypothetical protein
MTIAMIITTAVSLGFLGTAVLFNQQVSVMKDFGTTRSRYRCSSAAPTAARAWPAAVRPAR